MNENNNTEPVVYAVGTRGYSAYEVAVQNGFIGTEQEWLDSLVGPQGELGPEGKSAYQSAVDNGYIGTEEQWVNDFLTPDGYYNKNEIDNLIEGQLKQNDIEDNLLSEDGDKVLSAKQGKVLNTKIDNLISQENNDITQLQDQINGLGNGTPKASYNTTEDLIQDNPETGIYLILSDGYVYSYVKDSSSAIQLTQYQATGVRKNSIQAHELIEDINSILTKKVELKPTIETGKHYRIENGVAVANTTVSNYGSAIWDVLPNEEYYLSVLESSNKTYGYIFTDEEMNVITSGLQGTGSSVNYDDYLIKVPTGATKLLMSFMGNALHLKKLYYNTENSLKKSVYNDLIVDSINGIHYRIENGKVVSNDSSNSYTGYILSVNENENYYIKGTTRSSNTQLYVITDENDNVLEASDFGKQVPLLEEYYITIPKNARKVYISSLLGEQVPKIEIKKAVDMKNYLSGKNIAIIGDSISTKNNKNIPEITITEEDIGVELSAYLTYYDVDSNLSLGGHTFTSDEIGLEVTFTPTSEDVGKIIGKPLNYNGSGTITYWELLEEKQNCKVIPVCWSGASLSSHESNKVIYRTSYGWHDAQIRKCGIRVPGSMNRISPDVIIIYRGTNDFSHGPYVTIDTSVLDDPNYQYPETDYINNTYNIVNSFAITIKKLRETYPNAEIFIATLNVFKRVNYSHYPTNNGYYTLPQFNNVIRKIADYFGTGLIEFDKDGITFENCYSSGYITDSDTIPTHPNSKGHEKMYIQLEKDINKYINF